MSLRDTWHAWLGPAADTITDDQLATLDRVSREIEARWPDPDDEARRREALTAAMQVLVGDDTLEAIGEAWRGAVRTERLRMAALTGALLASSTGARYAHQPGSEGDLIARSGAARATVRKALGR